MPEQYFDVTLRVNGLPRSVNVPGRRLLSDALRHDIGLTGTHVGCEHGVCGCCTVLLDGKPVRSCLMFAVSARGHEITTVEGLNRNDGGLHPIQQAFADCHGLQCGFCTPGFLMSVSGLLAENPDPTHDEIVEGISGNLCRCTGYQNIIAAVARAAELLRANRRGDGEPAAANGAVQPAAGAEGAAPAEAAEGTERPRLEPRDEITPPQSAGQPMPYGPAGGAVPGAAEEDAS